MTFSLVGRCARTGAIGMVVTSSSVCVASRCAWVRAGVGAVASQNLTDPGLGSLGLALLERGLPVDTVRDMLVSSDPHADYRQLMVLDARGHSAVFTGSAALPTHAVAQGADCAAAGNMLRATEVPAAMVRAFEQQSELDLPERLLAALEAGLAAGGEVRELRSSGVLVAEDLDWPTVDLRVDCATHPLSDLRALWDIYKPLKDGYVSRSHSPHIAVLPPQVSAPDLNTPQSKGEQA
jgi:uncharacterized Ntn-hydrolase superfamily protein